MRIEGQDPLIKLIQQLNQNHVPSQEGTVELKPEEVLKEVELILRERDQVLLQGEKGSMTVQYSKKPGESPEAYLQRISLEISKQKENEKEMERMNEISKKGMEQSVSQTALYYELAKDHRKKEHLNVSTSDGSLPREKLLYIFFIVMLFSIILYILFKR